MTGLLFVLLIVCLFLAIFGWYAEHPGEDEWHADDDRVSYRNGGWSA